MGAPSRNGRCPKKDCLRNSGVSTLSHGLLRLLQEWFVFGGDFCLEALRSSAWVSLCGGTLSHIRAKVKRYPFQKCGVCTREGISPNHADFWFSTPALLEGVPLCIH